MSTTASLPPITAPIAPALHRSLLRMKSSYFDLKEGRGIGGANITPLPVSKPKLDASDIQAMKERDEMNLEVEKRRLVCPRSNADIANEKFIKGLAFLGGKLKEMYGDVRGGRGLRDYYSKGNGFKGSGFFLGGGAQSAVAGGQGVNDSAVTLTGGAVGTHCQATQGQAIHGQATQSEVNTGSGAVVGVGMAAASVATPTFTPPAPPIITVTAASPARRAFSSSRTVPNVNIASGPRNNSFSSDDETDDVFNTSQSSTLRSHDRDDIPRRYGQQQNRYA